MHVNYLDYRNHLINKGWVVLNFSESSKKKLERIKEIFLTEINLHHPKCNDLRDAHKYLTAQEFRDLHYQLNVSLNKSQLIFDLFQNEIELLCAIFGIDIDIQSYPTLRITRPGIKEDNLRIHRDIEYGASIYENSLWTPFFDINPGGGLKVLSSSIEAGYEGYSINQLDSPFSKDSKEAKSGLLYDYKDIVLNDQEMAMLEEPLVQFGQFLVIPQMLVHGSIKNDTQLTRWSVDTRICNPLVIDPISTLEKRRNDIRGEVQDGKGEHPFYRPLNRGPTLNLVSKFLNPRKN